MDSLVSKSISIFLAVELAAVSLQVQHTLALPNNRTISRLVDKCCQVGRERAIESAKFNCKLGAREALATGERSGQLLALAADSLLARDPNFGDQCEMVLESCCLAHHRTRNCNSGKQFAKSGSACMDVELSKEASVATESFNDCCMSCSLGILAARTPTQDNSTTGSGARLNERCKLMSPLASSLSGQLYEQTYIECCQENLPRPSSALVFDSGAPVDCSQANVCSQRCLAAGTPDPITRRPLDSDRCDCFAGFQLGSDGATCTDVDECRLNLHTCARHSEVCDNTRGSFRCLARTSGQTAAVRSLAISNEQQPPADESLVLDGERPFASLRLCAAGGARCPPVANSQHHQHQWKRQRGLVLVLIFVHVERTSGCARPLNAVVCAWAAPMFS